MNLWDVLAIVLVMGIAALAYRSMKKSAKKGCTGCCAGCMMQCGHGRKEP